MDYATAARRPHRQPAAQPRSVGHLLEQGAVRREGHRVPEDLPRDRSTRRRSSTIPGKGVSGFVGRGLKNANVAGVDRASCSATAATSSTRTASCTTDGPEAIEAAKMYQTLLAKDTGRRASPASTGTSAQSLFPAGQGGDVARRHRLRPAARGPDQVAHRRQGRLRRDAAGPEGAGLGAVRRRHRHLGATARRRARRGSICSGRSNKTNQSAHAAGGGRRARCATSAYAGGAGVGEPQGAEGVARVHARLDQDRAARACPRSSAGDRVPRRVRHRAHQHDQGRRPGEPSSRRRPAEFQPVLDKSEKG